MVLESWIPDAGYQLVHLASGRPSRGVLTIKEIQDPELQ